MPSSSRIRDTYARRKATLRRTLGTAALVLTGLLLLPSTASAQDRSTEDRIERRVESLRDALDLTDDQAAEVRALFETESLDRPPRGERGSGDREARRTARAERRAEIDRQLAEILTPEQMDAYQTWREENQPRRGRRGDG
ncbi:hypothetical protein [Rubrivirga marina]|uniref:Uncharacterized protein n=1 Tax=Rubrivirga marina TaxID=1196024 RepID=A0A271J5B3_9BACT|nr:hypothetical protein [Rubrivirga marina]PAP78498.1 hypothetical protein BSZ37_19750 [Rubrivirga marina]